MDWKYDSTEAVCNIGAYYSINYVFTYIHMPEESCCTLRMQNLNTTTTTTGHLFSWLLSCPLRLDHQDVDFGIRLIY